MREFGSIAEMILHLAVMDAETTLALHNGLKKCAVSIEQTAKSEIGEYQSAVAPFAGWVELADGTKEDRLRKGYSENSPLLRSGALRNSISHEIDTLEAVIGSDSDVMVYQELGTEKIPPRAVLGPAAVRNKNLIIRTLGRAAAEGLLYGSGTTVALLE